MKRLYAEKTDPIGPVEMVFGVVQPAHAPPAAGSKHPMSAPVDVAFTSVT